VRTNSSNLTSELFHQDLRIDSTLEPLDAAQTLVAKIPVEARQPGAAAQGGLGYGPGKGWISPSSGRNADDTASSPIGEPAEADVAM
jgi:hypothetical protein